MEREAEELHRVYQGMVSLGAVRSAIREGNFDLHRGCAILRQYMRVSEDAALAEAEEAARNAAASDSEVSDSATPAAPSADGAAHLAGDGDACTTPSALSPTLPAASSPAHRHFHRAASPGVDLEGEEIVLVVPAGRATASKGADGGDPSAAISAPHDARNAHRPRTAVSTAASPRAHRLPNQSGGSSEASLPPAGPLVRSLSAMSSPGGASRSGSARAAVTPHLEDKFQEMRELEQSMQEEELVRAFQARLEELERGDADFARRLEQEEASRVSASRAEQERQDAMLAERLRREAAATPGVALGTAAAADDEALARRLQREEEESERRRREAEARDEAIAVKIHEQQRGALGDAGASAPRSGLDTDDPVIAYQRHVEAELARSRGAQTAARARTSGGGAVLEKAAIARELEVARHRELALRRAEEVTHTPAAQALRASFPHADWTSIYNALEATNDSQHLAAARLQLAGPNALAGAVAADPSFPTLADAMQHGFGDGANKPRGAPPTNAGAAASSSWKDGLTPEQRVILKQMKDKFPTIPTAALESAVVRAEKPDLNGAANALFSHFPEHRAEFLKSQVRITGSAAAAPAPAGGGHSGGSGSRYRATPHAALAQQQQRSQQQHPTADDDYRHAAPPPPREMNPTTLGDVLLSRGRDDLVYGPGGGGPADLSYHYRDLMEAMDKWGMDAGSLRGASRADEQARRDIFFQAWKDGQSDMRAELRDMSQRMSSAYSVGRLDEAESLRARRDELMQRLVELERDRGDHIFVANNPDLVARYVESKSTRALPSADSKELDVDLHGLTATQARLRTLAVIELAYHRGWTSLCIITGRGNHSRNPGGELGNVVAGLLERLHGATNAKVRSFSLTHGGGAFKVRVRSRFREQDVAGGGVAHARAALSAPAAVPGISFASEGRGV